VSAGNAVVITGFGVVTPIGIGRSPFVAGLRSGSCGVGPITLFDASEYRSQVAAEVRGDVVEAAREASAASGIPVSGRYGRAAQFAMAAVAEALQHAGLHANDLSDVDTGLAFGGSTAGTLEAEAVLLGGEDDDSFWREVSELQLLLAPVGSTSDVLAKVTGLRGPVTTISTACSSATNAIGQATRWIRSGRCSRVIAGGADSLTRLTHAGFNSLSLVDRTRPLPFDARRDGMVIGEGAAFFVLEDESRARARGAELYGRVLGYGAIAEAHHLVQPRGDGEGAARAMGLALADAGVSPDRIDYINAHGTATPHNDAAEGRGIVTVLGSRAPSVPVSSTKSQVGHLLGASGAVELAACVLAMNGGFLPPTAGWAERDPEIPIEDFVAGGARLGQVEHCLSNSFAFGGNDASLCLGCV